MTERPAKAPHSSDHDGDGVNAWIALKITRGVGSMWCSYGFAGLALLSLPAVVRTHDLVAIVAWVAQTFLQLVLLSIIIVGQNISAATSDARAEATYMDAEAILVSLEELKTTIGMRK